MTSFDQTAVQGSSALQRGEDNPHKQRNSPLRESLQTLTHLCVPERLARAFGALALATKERQHLDPHCAPCSPVSLKVHEQPQKGDMDNVRLFSDLSLQFNNIRLQWCSNVSRPKVAMCWWNVCWEEEPGPAQFSWGLIPRPTQPFWPQHNGLKTESKTVSNIVGVLLIIRDPGELSGCSLKGCCDEILDDVDQIKLYLNSTKIKK